MIVNEEDYLAHYGRKGMKWYQHIYGDYQEGAKYANRNSSSSQHLKSDENLKKSMEVIEYQEFSTLKSPEEVRKSKKGSCHDQVMLELSELKKNGYKPKAGFIIEYDPKTGQGGMTHSFVYYNDRGKFKWFENSWGGRKGIHVYDSEDKLLDDVLSKFKSESNLPKIEMTDFGDHEPGETLQELVDKSLNNKTLRHR